MSLEMVKVPLEKIQIKGGTQPRAQLDESAIADYAERLKEGGTLPAVVAFFDGTDYWLADGFHRYHAYRAAHLDCIPVGVRNGSRRDAILFSVGANAAHGLRRTSDDKRRAVLTMLKDADWSKWPQSKIAEACAVSREFVSRVNTEISTSCDRSQDKTCTVERNGKPYEQNTTKIGKTKPKQNARSGKHAKPVDARKKLKPAAKAVQTPPAACEAATGTPEGLEDYDLASEMPTLEELLEAERRENAELQARIAALTQDDVVAELDKQIGIRQGIEQRLAQEMERISKLDKQLKRIGKYLTELRKFLDVEDNSQLLAAVKRLVEKAA